ncbi:hypothetical protein Aduo_015225 [Ancylostoma duodenale]
MNDHHDSSLFRTRAARATIRFDGLNKRTDPDTNRHNKFALRLMNEMNCAKLPKIERKLDFKEKAGVPSMKILTLNNTCKTWIVEELPPFVRINVSDVAFKWQPRKRDTPFQQLTSLYRYSLTSLRGLAVHFFIFFFIFYFTTPPENIKEYSTRANQSSGRDATLKNLPSEVEATLVGQGEDMLEFGKYELMSVSGVM